jgi:protein-tyrosine-phosphatase/peptidoglycan/xylan/chitin deacetylase (PgdA/CDA1 family)
MVGLRERLVRWLERCTLRGIRALSRTEPECLKAKRIIFLCTGNICRSPYAEAVARQKGAVAISCGTRTSPGVGADPVAVTVATRMGRDLSSHLTTRWEDVELRRGDIVVAMQVRHALKAYQRTLRAGVKVLVLGALVGPPVEVISDPFGSGAEEYSRVFSLIEHGIEALTRPVVPSREKGSPMLELAATHLFRIGVEAVKATCGRLIVALGLHRRMLKGCAIIVAFHSITKSRSDGALRCSVKDFESFCAFFSKYMDVVSLTDMVGHLETQADLKGQLAITFDDGYADNEELALPILKKWNLTATFYVASGLIGSQQQTPWDSKANVRSRWMSWQQVRGLISSGNEIGAHTVSHADLATLSREQVEAQLRQCRDTIRAKLACDPQHFAIPFGRSFPTIDSVLEVARAVGYKSVSFCRGGLVTSTRDFYCLERWPINVAYHRSPFSWIFDVLRQKRNSTLTYGTPASSLPT